MTEHLLVDAARDGPGVMLRNYRKKHRRVVLPGVSGSASDELFYS